MSFENSILSGTTLARENIQSEGYQVGLQGWIIERDGDAEFNSIVVRGDVISVGALYTTRILDGEIIIELNSNPVDNVRMNREGIEFNDSGTSSFTLLDYVDGEGLGFRDNSSTRGVYYDNDQGFLIVADSAPWTKEGWKALPGANGYTGGSYKLLPDGNILLDGQVGGGAAASPVQVGTLPAGYRPRAYAEFMTARGGAFGTNKITIDTAGVVTQWTPDATYNSSLAGIIFSTLA